MGFPSIGSLWRHTNGNIYEVLMITNSESTKREYPVTVVYKNTDVGSLWSRKLSDWNKSMTRI